MPLFPPVVRAYTRLTQGSSAASATLPDEAPITDSPARFTIWMVRRQARITTASAVFSLFWLLPGTLSPFLLGRAIDQGITQHNIGATVMWAALLAGVVLIGVISDVVASAFQISSWLDALYRTTKLVARKVAQMSHVIIKRVPAGEMLSVASSDSDTFGAFTEVTGRAIASLASFAFVTALVLSESVTLGLVVLASAPVILAASAPIIVPMQRNQRLERERTSTLTGMAVDIVSGLRILRGVGGEKLFGDNYQRQSQRVIAAGKRGGYWWGLFQAVSTLLTGCLLVLLTWLGIQHMLTGDLTVGQLISFFGYAVFLARPFATFVEFIQKWIQALVSARKTLGITNHEPPWTEPNPPSRWSRGQICDETSGFTANPGELTIIVSDVPDDSAALCDRLGRYLPIGDGGNAEEETAVWGAEAKRQRQQQAEQRAAQAARDEKLAQGEWGVTVDGVDISRIDLDELRHHVMVTDASAAVFAGTLQHLVDPHATHTREQAEQALWVASADDVWEALPDGWQGRIDERGRGLSGGQRQRLILARSLLIDPDVLVMVEPTSAVDAHTEARIADRLPTYRAGRTTILTTVSPLWLRHADRVVLLARDGAGPDGGKAVAAGTHAELMSSSPGYRAVVVRGEGVDQ